MKYIEKIFKLFLCLFFAYSTLTLADIKKAHTAYAAKEYKVAFEEYSKLAQHGNAEAQGKLGIMYFWGWGAKKIPSQAFKWSLKSAKQGDKLGQQMLGYLYEEGIVVNKNIRNAIKWYKKSAEQSFSPAIASLANIYIRGKEIPKNIKQGLKYAQLAAKNNHPYGQYLLGIIYQGEFNDYRQAKQWFTKASQLGYADATNQIGIHYYQGLGLEKNRKKAYFWFVIAEERGSVEGYTNRAKLRKNMEHVDIIAIEKDAMEWMKKNSIE